MADRGPRVVGILAGGGSLPREIARRVVESGGRVHIVALDGEGDDDYAPYPATVLGWGKIGGMLAALKGAGCTDLVIVGSVRRPDLAAVRPDLGLLLNLPAIMRIIFAGGDDSVLTRVVRFFEAKGLRVVGPAAFVPELLVPEGPLGRVAAQPAAIADVTLGFDLVRRLGPYDVGQAVVVAGGRVEAIEGAENTDAMLVRVAEQRRDGVGASGGVLVKRPKPGQELRVDLPAIGPATVHRAGEAGLGGIAVLAGGVLAVERPELARAADAAGIFVQEFADCTPPPAREAVKDRPGSFTTLGRRRPSAALAADATKAAALLEAVGPLVSRGAIVDRGHILAVESGEGVEALIRRAQGLRQWGRRRPWRRAAMAVLRDADDLAAGVRSGAAAGLAGVVLLGEGWRVFSADEAAADADRTGLFLAVLTPPMRTP